MLLLLWLLLSRCFYYIAHAILWSTNTMWIPRTQKKKKSIDCHLPQLFFSLSGSSLSPPKWYRKQNIDYCGFSAILTHTQPLFPPYAEKETPHFIYSLFFLRFILDKQTDTHIHKYARDLRSHDEWTTKWKTKRNEKKNQQKIITTKHTIQSTPQMNEYGIKII